MAGEIITQDELKQLLHYNPDTGLFTYLTGRIRTGRIAGNINKRGYVRLGINGVEYKGHRLAYLYMTGEMPQHFIDHINGIKSDNRWLNLREATNTQNNYNSGMKPFNTSGYKGISWDKKRNKWIAQISINNKNKYLGAFMQKEEAHAAYQMAASKLHGEFYYAGQP
jgi:hypothetical protein